MKIQLLRKVAELSLFWCTQMFGMFEYNPVHLNLSTDKRYTRTYGTYLDNIINIYTVTANTPRLVCSTVIHEYGHYMQFPDGDITPYYSKSWTISDNPYEIDCLNLESRNLINCYSYVKNNL